ncbi:MAG: glycosyltransferase family 4 protein [Pirellulaceae bacterium]
MQTERPSVAYLTAGAAGMLCGSCLHDNTLAKALIRRGVDAHLIPTYTPVRTDEDSVSEGRVFLGGINVYLDQVVPGYRMLPGWVTGLLDRPGLIRWATRRAAATSATSLGALTVSMLKGRGGYQRREMEQLCRWLADEVRPDLVVLSNALIAGCVPRLKELLAVPVLVTLQGDDIFLESLSEGYRQQAKAEIQRLIPSIDGFLVNSRYYADFMTDYLEIPPARQHVVPLGIDVTDFVSPEGITAEREAGRFTIGYLARLAPEKGLHLLCDAFVELKRRGKLPHARLRVAGWLGSHQHAFVEAQREKLRAAGIDGDVEWCGEVDRRGKVRFLRELDLLCVPTTYREPKGLYVLESLAAGTPVLQPAHGAFPELIEATGGGRLFAAGSPAALVQELEYLGSDPEERQRLGRTGRLAVHTRFHADAMAAAAWVVMSQFLRR